MMFRPLAGAALLAITGAAHATTLRQSVCADFAKRTHHPVTVQCVFHPVGSLDPLYTRLDCPGDPGLSALPAETYDSACAYPDAQGYVQQPSGG